MYFSINELLKDYNDVETVKETLNYAKQDEAVLKQVFLQFVIHRLGKKFQLVLDEMEDWNESEILSELVEQIFESESSKTDEISEKEVKQFVNRFFIELSVHDLLRNEMISDTTKLLYTIVSHPSIPKNASFRVKALFLMSALLNPIIRIKKTYQRNSERFTIPESFMSYAESAIKVFLKHIATGLKSSRFCCPIAEELTFAIQSNFEELSGNQNLMKCYKTMLETENCPLQLIALKSLRNLCESEEASEQLKDFLFGNSAEDEDEFEEGLVPILTELIQRKHLTTEVTSLLTAMNGIRDDRELLNQEQRQELYINVFSGNKKSVEETEKLMKSLQDDFWMETLKLFANFYSGTIDLKKFVEIVKSIEEINFDLEDMKKLVTDNLESPKISRAAATIFVELIRSDRCLIVPALELMHSFLPLCLADEDTFTIILEMFHIADSDVIATFYCSHHGEAVAYFNCLVKAFESFVSPLTLYNIVSAMAKLCSLSSQYFIQELRQIFSKLLLETSTYFNDHQTKDTSDYVNSFTKLAIIVENDSWNLLGQDNMDTIFFLAFSHCDNTESLLYPIISRYLCNILRHFVVRLSLDAPVPFKDYNDAGLKINNFAKNLSMLLHKKQSQENFHLIIASLLDILLIFQPAMQSKHNFYRIVNLEISRNEFQAIAVAVEEFLADKNKSSKYKREIVIKTFAKFVCNYERLPSRVAPWHVIRYYSLNYEFKDQIEILLNHAMEDKVFDQIVAVVILNYANLEEISQFRAFFQGIKSFLSSFFNENFAKQIAKISNVATIVLSKLPDHVKTLEDGNYADRLCSLDLILLMISDPVMRKKLHDLIPVKLAEAKLNKTEQKSLEIFKKKLLAEDN